MSQISQKTLQTFFSIIPAWNNEKKVRFCMVEIPDPDEVDSDTWNAMWKPRVQFWKDSVIAYCNYFSIFTTTIPELEKVFQRGSSKPPSIPLITVFSFYFPAFMINHNISHYILFNYFSYLLFFFPFQGYPR